MSNAQALYTQFQQAQEEARNAGVPAQAVDHVALLLVLQNGGSATAAPAPADESAPPQPSLREYLSEHMAHTQRDIFLIALSYMSKYRGLKACATATIASALEDARFGEFGNPSAVAGRAADAGEVGVVGKTESGHNLWRLSREGTKRVNDLRRPAEEDA